MELWRWRRDRPDMETNFLPELERFKDLVDAHVEHCTSYLLTLSDSSGWFSLMQNCCREIGLEVEILQVGLLYAKLRLSTWPRSRNSWGGFLLQISDIPTTTQVGMRLFKFRCFTYLLEFPICILQSFPIDDFSYKFVIYPFVTSECSCKRWITYFFRQFEVLIVYIVIIF